VDQKFRLVKLEKHLKKKFAISQTIWIKSEFQYFLYIEVTIKFEFRVWYKLSKLLQLYYHVSVKIAPKNIIY